MKPQHRPQQRDHRRPIRHGEALPLPENLPQFPGVACAVLRPGAATPVLAGHPWVFSGAIAHLRPAPGADRVQPGQACAVLDPHGRWLGLAYVNPQSQIALRVLEPGTDGLEPRTLPDIRDLVRVKLATAARLRHQLQLPGSETDAFRLVNSEGDGLPGLTVDRFGAHGDGGGAVVQATTAGAYAWLPTVAGWLMDEEHCAWVVARVPDDVHPSEGLQKGWQQDHGAVPQKASVRWNGLQLFVEPKAGQKTGAYCDQRENHKRVAELCTGMAGSRGAFVVDAYCHTGGFGLHAAKAGARRVWAVDSSQRAVDLATTHAAMNGLDTVYRADCEDAVIALRHYAQAQEDSERPEIVIVDPPKFATRAAVLEDALKKYHHLNATALKAVQPGGWLVTCSCSGLVSKDAFLRMIGHAAHEARRTVRVVELRGPGPDHPVAPAHAEGSYLKVAFVRVEGRDVG
jgi:23S rRNA (cytosine1962-C5)-methyltransferase